MTANRGGVSSYRDGNLSELQGGGSTPLRVY